MLNISSIVALFSVSMRVSSFKSSIYPHKTSFHHPHKTVVRTAGERRPDPEVQKSASR